MIALLVALVIAVSVGLGTGGGGLLVLYLTLCGGRTPIEAQGVNLLFFLAASGAALLWHGKRRRWRWAMLLTVAAAGVLFAALGAYLATRLSGALLRRLFGALLVASGLLSLHGRP